MTSVAWTQRLVARGRWLLGLGLFAALVTTGLTLHLARDDGHRRYPIAASATAVPLGEASFTLVGLRSLAELPGTYETTSPVRGASFVIVDLDADLTARGDRGGCLVYLRAGDYEFVDQTGYTPTDAAATTSCESGSNSRVQLAFEVPTRLLDQVSGVRIQLSGEDAPLNVILPGKLA